jgi:hypothetical protein
MFKDITGEIADLVFKSTPDLCAQLKQQAQKLAGIACNEPVIGRWIEANDLDYLVAAFSLNDDDFTQRFPTAVATTKQERRQLIKRFRAHVKTCPHCASKDEGDRALDQLIDRALTENRLEFVERLKESLVTADETKS